VGITTTGLFYSAAWQVLEEKVGSNTANRYVWSPVYVDAMVLRDRDTDANGTPDERLWVQQDANFNVTALVAMVNGTAEVVERYGYDPFGAATVLDTSWTVDADGKSDFGWVHLHQGLRYDEAAALYDNNGRWFSPGLGRFTSLDPIRFYAGDPNLYRYEANGPSNSLDPSGLQKLEKGGQDFPSQSRRPGRGPMTKLGKPVDTQWTPPSRPTTPPPPLTKFPQRPSDPQQLDYVPLTPEQQMQQYETAAILILAPAVLAFPATSMFVLGGFTVVCTVDGHDNGQMQKLALEVGGYKVGSSLLRKSITSGAANPVQGRLQRPFDQRCFPADTLVATEAGHQPISRIERGMKVWACNTDTGTWSLKPVLNTFSHAYEGDVIAVGAAGTIFRATGNHPVWVVAGEGLDQRGQPEHIPASSANGSIRGRWVQTRELRVGDKLLLRSSEEAAVESLVVSQEALPVYNMEVADDHTYAVGTAQVLVHNKPMEFYNPPDAPVQPVGKPDKKWFSDRGLDPHEIKDDLGVGPGVGGRYDVFKDRDGNLWVGLKDDTGEKQWRGSWIEEN
jgi:RHS repeat-associated protein